MTEGKPLRFSNLQLKNWKNFAFCNVAVGRRAFLVGPNAAGKSNFLDVFLSCVILLLRVEVFSKRLRVGVGSVPFGLWQPAAHPISR
jgi:predicted ATP-binding protein involved in virulence